MKNICLILLSICWLTACNPDLVNQDDSSNAHDQHDQHSQSLKKAQKISLSIPNTIDWKQFKHVAYDRHTILAKPYMTRRGKSTQKLQFWSGGYSQTSNKQNESQRRRVFLQ